LVVLDFRWWNLINPLFSISVMKFWYELRQISIIFLGFRFLEFFDLFLSC
jgi:hypothetical protein